MRKCKRIVSAMLAVSMVMGMTAFPALAEPLGIQGESRVETGITVVSNTYTYGNAAVTSYYANGNPVTVKSTKAAPMSIWTAIRPMIIPGSRWKERVRTSILPSSAAG